MMKSGLKHFARAGLLGFIALFTIGAMIVAEQAQRKSQRSTAHAESAPDNPEGTADADGLEGEAATEDRSETDGGETDGGETDGTEKDAAGKAQAGALFAMGLVGALTAIAAVALLWWFFPVGPASKIVIGAVCGPFVPVMLFLPEHLKAGKAGDIAGVVVIGMLIGALAGLLEANRVKPERAAA